MAGALPTRASTTYQASLAGSAAADNPRAGGAAYNSMSVFSFHYYNPPNVGKKQSYINERVRPASLLCVCFPDALTRDRRSRADV